MPTASGQYQLQDYISELQSRGFDGFTPADLITYVNRGYFAVARKSQWFWEETVAAFTLTPGQFTSDLWPAVNGILANFKSLDKLVITTSGKQVLLRVRDEVKFFQDLASGLGPTPTQGEPSWYYIYQGKLYILPPPDASRDFLAYYHQQVSPLVSGTDVPITPQDLDEAILLAALSRCHTRSNEPTLAALVDSDLEEIYDDMRDEEEMRMGEKQDRVRPDNTWL